MEQKRLRMKGSHFRIRQNVMIKMVKTEVNWCIIICNLMGNGCACGHTGLTKKKQQQASERTTEVFGALSGKGNHR